MKKKPITSLVFLSAGFLTLTPTLAKDPNLVWIQHLTKEKDHLLTENYIKKSNLSLTQVLSELWRMLESSNKKEQEVADNTLAKMSVGLLLPPIVFSIDERTYYTNLTEFLSEKYKGDPSKDLRQAAAIYMRQIENPMATEKADKLGMPHLDDLASYEWED
jgi:hypothetical protein